MRLKTLHSDPFSSEQSATHDPDIQDALGVPGTGGWNGPDDEEEALSSDAQDGVVLSQVINEEITRRRN